MKRTNIWIVVLLVAIGAGGAYAFARSKPDVYSSSTVVRVFDPSDAGSVAATPGFDPARAVRIEVLYARSSAVADAADRLLGPAAPQVKSVSVTGSTDTDTIAITARSTSPEVAQRAAQAYATAFIAQRRRALDTASAAQVTELKRSSAGVRAQIAALDRRISSLQLPVPFATVGGATVAIPQSDQLRNLDAQRAALVAQLNQLSAQVAAINLARTARATDLTVVLVAARPAAAVAPRPIRDAVVGGAIGLLLGLVVVAIRTRWRRKVSTSSELAAVMPALPFIAPIPPRWSTGSKRRQQRAALFEAVNGRDALGDAYRVLRASVVYGEAKVGGTSVLVTTAGEREGKTTIAANLALSLARAGDRVVLVDCDLRHPALHRQFGFDAGDAGLSSVLAAAALPTAVSRVVRTIDIGGATLDVLPAGPVGSDPTALLGRAELLALLVELGRNYERVILDGPSVLSAAEGLALARAVDGVLLVVRAGETKVKTLRQFDLRMRSAPARVIGAVLLGVRIDRPAEVAPIDIPVARWRLVSVDATIDLTDDNGNGNGRDAAAGNGKDSSESHRVVILDDDAGAASR